MKNIIISWIIFISYFGCAHAQIGPGQSCPQSAPCYVINSGGGGSTTVNQGTQAITAAGSTWFVDLYVGGSEVGLTNPLAVQPGTGSVFPISASALPLPTGASTDASLTDVQSAPGTPQTTAETVQGNASGVPIPISAASFPLPTGAATAANQTNGSQLAGILGQDSATISSPANPVPVSIYGLAGVTGTPNQVSATCTTSSSIILASNAASQSESFHLAATAANPVWLNFAGATAVQAAPSFDLQPGQTITWNMTGALLPTASITCIASASTAVTEIYK